MKKLLAAVVFVGLGLLPLRAEILEQVLVKVNGEIFTKSELEERQVSALRQRNRGITAQDLKTDAELKKALDEITPQLVADVVDEMLVMQRGKELGYKMTDERFKTILDNIRKENNLENEEAFEGALKQEGMTLADLRKSLERQLVMSQVQQVEVFNKIAVTEAEAQAYYDEHRTEFTTPATLTLREILVEVAEAQVDGQKGVNVGADEQARDKADRLRVRAVGGDDFAKLAAAESDAASKANGGLIGPINEEELAPALRQLIAKMKVGEVTQPLRTQKGYQILKLENRTETKILAFDAARDQISDKVFQQKRRGEMQRYLEKLRAQAIIEWKNDEIKKAYDQAMAQRQQQPPSGSGAGLQQP